MFSQRNETNIETVVASRSTIETVTKVNEKAKGLKQNPPPAPYSRCQIRPIFARFERRAVENRLQIVSDSWIRLSI
jgi:hypothetical protein